jgi:hypothetical protein
MNMHRYYIGACPLWRPQTDFHFGMVRHARRRDRRNDQLPFCR